MLKAKTPWCQTLPLRTIGRNKVILSLSSSFLGLRTATPFSISSLISDVKNRNTLVSNVGPAEPIGRNKVTIVGIGQVGMACAIAILSKRISNDLALVDMAEQRLMGEMLDLQHGTMFLNNPKIAASTDYAVTAGSRLCIVTSGVRQKEGETRLQLIDANTEIMKQIIPPLVKYSPDTILLIVANPADIMTYVSWKISGLPENRVIGSGTNLDSSRFCFHMAERLGVSVSSCNAWVIGEHGDSSVPVWSTADVAGVRLKELNPAIGEKDDPENWAEVHEKVVNGAYEVIKLKGYTNWAIGLSVASIAACIMHNTGEIQCLSIRAKGLHGITQDVYLSLPVGLGAGGVTDVIKLPLTDSECAALQKSAAAIAEVQDKIGLLQGEQQGKEKDDGGKEAKYGCFCGKK